LRHLSCQRKSEYFASQNDAAGRILYLPGITGSHTWTTYPSVNEHVLVNKLKVRIEKLIILKIPILNSSISQDPDYTLMLAESQRVIGTNACSYCDCWLKNTRTIPSSMNLKSDFELRNSIINNIEANTKESRRKNYSKI